MQRVLVLSAHLDDAVLSAGEFIAAHPGATVATVFAGVPEPGVRGWYDRQTETADGHAAMTLRRAEDAAALAVLDASALHLDLFDRQYRCRASDDGLAALLRDVLGAHRPDVVVGPVGLLHPDHRQLARVWPAVARERPGTAALAYEDLPYRLSFAETAGRVRQFAAAHGAVAEAPGARNTDRKAAAIAAYASQLPLVYPDQCLVPERLWRLWRLLATEQRAASVTP